jgi:hypothetical protein
MDNPECAYPGSLQYSQQRGRYAVFFRRLTGDSPSTTEKYRARCSPSICRLKLSSAAGDRVAPQPSRPHVFGHKKLIRYFQAMLEQAIRRKIEELVRRAPLIISEAHKTVASLGEGEGWVTEAVNVIEVAIPIESNSYRRRVRELEKRPIGVDAKVAAIAACLRAFLPDVDAGLIADFGNKVRAETFDDFLDYAEAYRQEDEKQAAGVLAGVVFEDTIRRICRDKGITGKDLEQLINALTRRNVITGQQNKQAKLAAHVRAKATHALWDGYDLDGVAATIQLTRTFLREHLGG